MEKEEDVGEDDGKEKKDFGQEDEGRRRTTRRIRKIRTRMKTRAGIKMRMRRRRRRRRTMGRRRRRAAQEVEDLDEMQ